LGTANQSLPGGVVKAAVEVHDEAEPFDCEVSDIEEAFVLQTILSIKTNAFSFTLIRNQTLRVELHVLRFFLRIAEANYQNSN
jgi:hypothetical protein